MLCQECLRAVFWARYCSSCTPGSFSIIFIMPLGYADDFAFLSVVPSPNVRVPVAESRDRDIGTVSKLRNIWEMKLKRVRLR